MGSEQDKWRAEEKDRDRQHRREIVRIVLYAILVSAALLAAGAALWEVVRFDGLQ